MEIKIYTLSVNKIKSTNNAHFACEKRGKDNINVSDFLPTITITSTKFFFWNVH